jgi:hypothetical protein
MPGGDHLARRLAQLDGWGERQSLHEALGIDMGVKKCAG